MGLEARYGLGLASLPHRLDGLTHTHTSLDLLAFGVNGAQHARPHGAHPDELDEVSAARGANNRRLPVVIGHEQPMSKLLQHLLDHIGIVDQAGDGPPGAREVTLLEQLNGSSVALRTREAQRRLHGVGRGRHEQTERGLGARDSQ